MHQKLARSYQVSCQWPKRVHEFEFLHTKTFINVSRRLRPYAIMKHSHFTYISRHDLTSLSWASKETREALSTKIGLHFVCLFVCRQWDALRWIRFRASRHKRFLIPCSSFWQGYFQLDNTRITSKWPTRDAYSRCFCHDKCATFNIAVWFKSLTLDPTCTNVSLH